MLAYYWNWNICCVVILADYWNWECSLITGTGNASRLLKLECSPNAGNGNAADYWNWECSVITGTANAR
jgi:hypothetical protein